MPKPKLLVNSGGQETEFLKLLHWNVECINSRTFGKKSDNPTFQKIINNHDITGFTETHANADTTINVPGYYTYQVCRTRHAKAKKNSGGLAALVKNSLREGVSFIQSSCGDIIWIKLKKEFFAIDSDIFIGIIYIIPKNSSYTQSNNVHTWEVLEDEIWKHSSSGQVILMGDLNSRTSNLPDYIQNDDTVYTPTPNMYKPDDIPKMRLNSDLKVCDFGHKLIALCQTSGLRIVNGRKLDDTLGMKTCHKWNGSSTVDYAISHVSLFPQILSFRVLDILNEWSDHCPITINLNISISRNNSAHHQCSTKCPRKLKWTAERESTFIQYLSSTPAQTRLSELALNIHERPSDIEDHVTNIYDIIYDAANVGDVYKFSKNKTKRRGTSKPTNSAKKNKHKTWFNESLQALRQKLNTLGKSLCSDPSNPYLRGKFFSAKKLYKSTALKTKRNYKKHIMNQLIGMEHSDPKAYWQLVEKLKEADNPIQPASSVSLEDWVKHYKDLLSDKNDSPMKSQYLTNRINELRAAPFFSELDFRFTNDEIRKALDKLKHGKAVGIDIVSNEMLKASGQFLTDIYCQLFNAILQNSHYPKSWKTGMIVNLFKDGNACDPNNYRGLTINSCLGKVFNSVINNRLIEFLDKNNIIDNKQIGFKRKARTSDHIFIVNALIQKYRKNKEHLYMCFVDFKKAFDSVWHLALKLKLLEYGISGKFYDIIDNMYKDNLNCIKSDGQLSNTFSCARGVKQGDILSPNLFNLYINDLPNKLGIDVDTPELNGEPINCLLYADDLIIFSRTREGLQNKLNILDSYCQEWCLSANPKKTKIMYTGKNSGESAPFMVGDASLEYTSHYKYLGVEINANNKVAETVQNLCTRSWKA